MDNYSDRHLVAEFISPQKPKKCKVYPLSYEDMLMSTISKQLLIIMLWPDAFL